jgi:hypothetical protein
MSEPRYRIHPAIGIGRVGDAPRGLEEGDGWYVGPEQPGVPARWDGVAGRYLPFKTEDGRVMARAARFRVFEYREGAPPREVVVGRDAKRIVWRVEVANRKAAFFKFLGPLGEWTLYGSPLHFLPQLRRNPRVSGSGRASLVLSSPVVEIGSEAFGEKARELQNLNGRVADQIPTLGDVRVDAAGRLIVCGGYGRAAYDQELGGVDRAVSLKDFANSPGWFDDIADGPVSATIVLDGDRKIEVGGEDAAWFMSAPPDFAPAVPPFRSMWDTLLDLFVRERPDELRSAPEFAGTHWLDLAGHWKKRGRTLGSFRPSFMRDIYPLLESAAAMTSVFSFDDRPVAHHRFFAELMPRLGGAGSSADARLTVFRRIRDPKCRRYDLTQMPFANGDFFPIHDDSWYDPWLRRAARLRLIPRALATVSELQYALLRRWVDGEFVEDWHPPPRPGAGGAVSPVGLDRAALESSAGGAFFPGIEASWLFAGGRLFGAPLRLKPRGTVLRRFGAIGRIAIEPGIVTAQMASPWHADFASCRKTTSAAGLPKIGWWPTQRPDSVFVRDAGRALRPVRWARGADEVSDDGARQILMVGNWSTYGFVVADGAGGPLVEAQGPPAP